MFGPIPQTGLSFKTVAAIYHEVCTSSCGSKAKVFFLTYFAVIGVEIKAIQTIAIAIIVPNSTLIDLKFLTKVKLI